MIFSNYLVFYFLLLYFLPSPSPSPKSLPLSHFPDQITCTLPFPFLVLPKHSTPALVPFHFPSFCSYSQIPGDLEPGASYENGHLTFVFLGLEYLTK